MLQVKRKKEIEKELEELLSKKNENAVSIEDDIQVKQKIEKLNSEKHDYINKQNADFEVPLRKRISDIEKEIEMIDQEKTECQLTLDYLRYNSVCTKNEFISHNT